MRRPSTYTSLVRLPPPSIGVYRQDRLVRKGGRWRRRPDRNVTNQVFYVILSIAALVFVYGLLAVTP
jgi:hypothetical protein